MGYIGNQITTVFPSSVTVDKINDVTYVPNPPSGQITGRRNIVINGAMQVAQRGTSTSGVTTATYIVDRFFANMSSLGTWTISQSTTAPDGFSNSFKMDCTTADASPSSGDFLQFKHRIEAQDLQQLKYGTSSAESVTISFYVRSNKTGTYILEILQPDASNRLRSASYTINSANTWEQKVITFSGDTSGVINNDNGTGIELTWWLGAGSNFTSGTLQTDWGALDQTTRAVGNVNLADSDSNEWYITGVQMEVGEVTNPIYEHRSFGEEKRLCQRYYFQTENKNFAGVATATNRVICGYRIPDMRATPSFTFVSFNGTTARLSRATNNADTVFSSASVTSLNGFFQITSTGNTFIANEGYFAQLKCESEL